MKVGETILAVQLAAGDVTEAPALTSGATTPAEKLAAGTESAKPAPVKRLGDAALAVKTPGGVLSGIATVSNGPTTERSTLAHGVGIEIMIVCPMALAVKFAAGGETDPPRDNDGTIAE